MPNAKVHLPVGAVSGGVVVALRADPASMSILLESLVGALGGLLGAAAPDALEPAVSPKHRNFFHSAVAGGALWASSIEKWDAECRRRSSACQTAAGRHTPGCTRRIAEERNAVLWCLAGAFVTGFAVGYLSHLTLDAGTPDGLPLIVR